MLMTILVFLEVVKDMLGIQNIHFSLTVPIHYDPYSNHIIGLLLTLYVTKKKTNANLYYKKHKMLTSKSNLISRTSNSLSK